MKSPIDRIFNLKYEAAKRGVVAPEKAEGFRFHAGRRFIAELLMDYRMRTTSMSSLRFDTWRVFGVEIVESDNVGPNDLKLVFELNG